MTETAASPELIVFLRERLPAEAGRGIAGRAPLGELAWIRASFYT